MSIFLRPPAENRSTGGSSKISWRIVRVRRHAKIYQLRIQLAILHHLRALVAAAESRGLRLRDGEVDCQHCATILPSGFSPGVNLQSESTRIRNPAVRQIRVSADEAGQRLDNFLAARLKGVPRTRLYRIIRRGEVRVNGGRSQPATRLAEGDVVRVPPVRTAPPRSPGPVPASLSRPERLVIYADEDILVIDKPSGVAVHGGTGVSVGVIEALKRSALGGDFLELAHRLDRETSGCLVLARRRESLLALHRLFRRETDGVIKRYEALLHGEWDGDRQRVTAPLLRYRDATNGQSRVRTDPDGQNAASVIEKEETLPGATRVRITLETGRMHQARVHCRELGFPIAGDALYGDFAANRRYRAFGLTRLFLHACELSMPHPVHRRRMTFTAPLSRELQVVLESLRDRESCASG